MYHSLPSLPTGVFVHAMLRVSCNTSDDHQPRVPIYSSSLCQSSSQWCTDDDSMMQNANASARKWNLVDFSDPRSTKSRFKSWLMHPASIGLFTRTSSQPRRHSHLSPLRYLRKATHSLRLGVSLPIVAWLLVMESKIIKEVAVLWFDPARFQAQPPCTAQSSRELQIGGIQCPPQPPMQARCFIHWLNRL